MTKDRRSIRVHEWAAGDGGIRTVCGLTRIKPGARVVSNLGEIVGEYRCANCDRMRGTIGESSKERAR